MGVHTCTLESVALTLPQASSSKTANQVGGFVKASAMHNSNKKRLNEHDGAQSGKSPKKVRLPTSLSCLRTIVAPIS